MASEQELLSREKTARRATSTTANTDEYQKLLDTYSHFATLSEGDILKGRVLKITENEVIVDVGYKCEGLIPVGEFRDRDGRLTVRAGDIVDVMLETTEERDGYVRLSRQKAERMRVWDDIERAYQQQSVVTGRVVERIKGGLSVDIGVRAFLPGSQVDIKPLHNLDAFRGKDIPVKVIKLNKKRGNIVVSRKAVLEQESASRKEKTLGALFEGAVVRGVVKNITEYGVFIDLGGIDGLLHITDLSWGRVSHPSEILQVNDEVDVVVLKFDREKERVSLGLKQLYEDPWTSADQKYPVGYRVRGKVVSVTDYGAFVELEPGVEGLIHVSEMSWSKRLKHPSKVVSAGDTIEADILEVNPAERRISLSLRQTEPNPWYTLTERYQVGDKVSGRVRNLTDFGAFVEVEEGIDGLVHVSDISWTRRIKHPSEALKKGDKVEAIILHIDPDNRRLSLGIKQLQPDAWEAFFSQAKLGDLVRGRVVRMASFGAFVQLAEGIEGLCHVSEINLGEQRDRKGAAAPSEGLEVGQEYDFKIIKLNPPDKKIGLSLRAVVTDAERQEIEEYLQRQNAAGATTTLQEMVSLKERTSSEND
jgi:small subunit ribosomal protein S1